MIHKNMLLREAIVIAQSLGATVENKRRKGELRFFHPWMRKNVVTSQGRKDCCQPLVGWLRQLHNLTQSHNS